jgi:hypothetical protein
VAPYTARRADVDPNRCATLGRLGMTRPGLERRRRQGKDASGRRGVPWLAWIVMDRQGSAGMASPGLDGFGSAGMARHVGRDKAQRGWLGLDGNAWPVAAWLAWLVPAGTGQERSCRHGSTGLVLVGHGRHGTPRKRTVPQGSAANCGLGTARSVWAPPARHGVDGSA